MKRMKLKHSLLFGAIAISVFSMIVAMTAVTLIIDNQNTTASHDVIKTAFNVIIDDLTVKHGNLLASTRQLAGMKDVGAQIKFLMENKSQINVTLTRDAYRKFTNAIYNIGISAKIWKMMVYDRDGDLVSFAMISDAGASFGYAQGFPTPVFQVVSLQPGEEDTQESWTQMNSFQEIEATFGRDIPDHEIIRFELFGQWLSLVSYVPVMGWVYNQEKGEMESVQLGIAMAVQPLDTPFVERISKLTGTNLHVFTREALSVGEFTAYKAPAPTVFGEIRENWMPSLDELILNEIKLDDSGYFQGVLPLYADTNYVGAIAALYSKDVAKANTLQMIKILILVSLGCIVLILPLDFLFSNILTTPICRVIDVGKKIAEGRLGDIIQTDYTRDIGLATKRHVPREIGALAEAFQEMIMYLQDMAQTATHIASGDLDQEIMPRSQDDVLGTAFQQMSVYLHGMSLLAKRIAEGDLSETVQARSTIDAFGQAIQSMTEGLRSLIMQIRTSAEKITSLGAKIGALTATDVQIVQEINMASVKMLSTMMEMGASVEEVAHSMETLSTSVEETSSSISQMAASIAQIAANTTELTQQTQETIVSLGEAISSVEHAVESTDTSKTLSQETIDDAIQGQQAVEQVKSSMETIHQTVTTAEKAITQFAQRSRDIDTILEVIREITDQTTLLALNASIIAAQAGEHGRGFAVVAGEIKNLADGVGTSTKDIAEIVRSLQQDTARVVQTIHAGALDVHQGLERTQQAQQTLQNIFDSAQRSSTVVAEITDTLHALKATSQHVSAAMERVNLMAADITRATNEQKSTTENINIAIAQINDMAMQIQKATSEQLTGVRQVLDTVTNMTQQNETNLESSQTIAQTTNILASEADTLSHSVDRFKLKA